MDRLLSIERFSRLGKMDIHLRRQWGTEKRAPHNPLPYISLLFEHGADPNIRDKNGKTPIDLATEAKWDPEYMKKCPPWWCKFNTWLNLYE
jgi:hypothetical protein